MKMRREQTATAPVPAEPREREPCKYYPGNYDAHSKERSFAVNHGFDGLYCVSNIVARVIHSLSFTTWCRNHEDRHNARWCRELYPWEVFASVDYSEDKVGSDQVICCGASQYHVQVLKYWRADNGRINFLVHLKTRFGSRQTAWEHRHWNDTFQLVTEPDGYFITLYTKKEDPSKMLLTDFMNGQFARVGLVRSKPLSALLFQSIIAYAAEEAFGPLSSFVPFPLLSGLDSTSGHPTGADDRPAFFAPFLSQGRDLWPAASKSGP